MRPLWIIQFTIFHFDCIQVPCCVGKINIDVQAGPDGIASKYSYPHPKPQLREAQLSSQPEPVPVDGTAQRGEVCPKVAPGHFAFLGILASASRADVCTSDTFTRCTYTSVSHRSKGQMFDAGLSRPRGVMTPAGISSFALVAWPAL